MSRFLNTFIESVLCCVRIALLICTNDCNGALRTTITKIRNLYKSKVDESKRERLIAQLMDQPEGGLSLPRSLCPAILFMAFEVGMMSRNQF